MPPPQLTKLVPKQAPTLLDSGRANEIIDRLNGLAASTGSNGIKVSVEGSGKLAISGDKDGLLALLGLSGTGSGTGGGELPDGFGEEILTICVNGSPQDRVFLTRTV